MTQCGQAEVLELTRCTDARLTHAGPRRETTGICIRDRQPDVTRHSTRRRRGVTLVEMLVTVAMLVIIMTILVQIFQAATGSLTAAQAYQELDNQLRLLDSTIRSDLRRDPPFTPPLDPRTTWATSSTARTSSPTSRAKTATTTSGSPPRPPPAGRSPGGCGFAPLGVVATAPPNQLPSRSRSPASTPRSSTSSATATCTAASCSSPRAPVDDRAVGQQREPQPQPPTSASSRSPWAATR